MVATPTTTPFFSGTHEEIGNRICDASPAQLLKVIRGDTQHWGGLILRVLVEKTPFVEVRIGSTPAGLYLRNRLLFEEKDKFKYESPFENYGEELWGLFAAELHRIVSDGVYPMQLMERVGDILLTHQSMIINQFLSYTSKHPHETRMLRLAAALNPSEDRTEASRYLRGSFDGEVSDGDATLSIAFDLMGELGKTIASEQLLDIASNSRFLPELRAAALKSLCERKDIAHDLIPFAFLSIIENPGNAAALHTACWRAPRFLPSSALTYVGRKILTIDSDRFERHEGGFRRWAERDVRRHMASAHYFLNLPLESRIAHLNQEHAPLAIKFAAMMILMHTKGKVGTSPLAIAAEFQFVNMLWDVVALNKLMRAYEYAHVPGRPNWRELAALLPQYKGQLTATCAELMANFGFTGRNGDWPTASTLVRFLRSAWKHDKTIRGVHRKQLKDILAYMGNDTRFLDAYREMCSFLHEKQVIK